MPLWFGIRQSWLNPLICGERGALGASQRCQQKPRHNLRPSEAPLSLLLFTHRGSTLSHCLFFHLLFFLMRWDFIGPPLSVTAIGCEISEGKACGNHSISCAHLAQHLYRRAGGFWKGEKSFTKRTSEAGFNTSSGNTFKPRSTSPLRFPFCSVLVFFVYHLWHLIARSIYNIVTASEERASICMSLCSRDVRRDS